MDTLPFDILVDLFDLLSLYDLIHLSQCSTSLHEWIDTYLQNYNTTLDLIAWSKIKEQTVLDLLAKYPIMMADYVVYVIIYGRPVHAIQIPRAMYENVFY